MKRLPLLSILAIVLFFNFNCAFSQNHIVLTSGKILDASIIKSIGKNEVQYKKGTTKEIKSTKVLYVEYNNGTRVYVNPIHMAKNYQAFGVMPDKNVPVGTYQAHFIERIGDKFRIDTNQIVKYKELNSLLKQSPDTATLVLLKGANALRIVSNISDILAAPASVTGGIGSITTIDTFLDLKKTGELTPKTYIDMGLSFLGTSALPIASGIMEAIKKKLYNKTIKSYSAPKKAK